MHTIWESLQQTDLTYFVPTTTVSRQPYPAHNYRQINPESQHGSEVFPDNLLSFSQIQTNLPAKTAVKLSTNIDNFLLLVAHRIMFCGAPSRTLHTIVRRTDWDPQVFHAQHQHLLNTDKAIANDNGGCIPVCTKRPKWEVFIHRNFTKTFRKFYVIETLNSPLKFFGFTVKPNRFIRFCDTFIHTWMNWYAGLKGFGKHTSMRSDSKIYENEKNY